MWQETTRKGLTTCFHTPEVQEHGGCRGKWLPFTVSAHSPSWCLLDPEGPEISAFQLGTATAVVHSVSGRCFQFQLEKLGRRELVRALRTSYCCMLSPKWHPYVEPICLTRLRQRCRRRGDKTGRAEGREESWEMLSSGCDPAFIHELAESVLACLRPEGLHKTSQ